MPFLILSETIPPEFDGRPVRTLLKARGVSARLCIRLKNTPDGITMDGKPVRTIDPLRAGAVLTLRIPEDERPARSTGARVPVVYEDEHIIVFDKPPFMTVHPVHEYRENTLADAFATHLADQGKFAAFRPVGRLDRNTSGLVLCAKHQLAARRLEGAFSKAYFCICRGSLSGSGTVDGPLRLREGHGIRREVGEGGEAAVTHYTSIAAGESYSACLVTMETGRTHQIRAHFSHLGHPLAGDDMYGDEAPQLPRHALHCYEMILTHPAGGEALRLFSPIPPDLREFARRQGLALPNYLLKDEHD